MRHIRTIRPFKTGEKIKINAKQSITMVPLSYIEVYDKGIVHKSLYSNEALGMPDYFTKMNERYIRTLLESEKFYQYKLNENSKI